MGDVLSDAGVPFWLEWGALLGYARDGDLIPHDGDIDIGVMARDWTVECEQKLVDAGFSLRTYAPSLSVGRAFMLPDAPHVPAFYKVILNKGTCDVDIYFEGPGYGIDSECRFMTTEFRRGILEFPATMLEERQTIHFLGRDVEVPADIEAYLEHAYGPDWRSPDKNCSYPCFVELP